MTSSRDSWVNAYEHVDFDVPIFTSSSISPGKEHERAERQAMLPSGSGTTKDLVSPPSSPEPEPDSLGFSSRFPSGSIPPSSPVKHSRLSPSQLPATKAGPPTPPKTGSLQPPTPIRTTTNFKGPPHQAGGSVKMPAQAHALLHTRAFESASSPPATSPPPMPPSSSTSSGTLVASGSSSSNLFGFGSSAPSSSSNPPGAVPQLTPGALVTNDATATPDSEKVVPTGQLSSQTTTSVRSPRSSSFKSYAPSPLAVSSPSGSNSNTNPQYAVLPMASPQAPVTGSASFSRHTPRSDGFNASSSTSIPPSTSISTDRTSPVPLMPPSSFPSRGSMILYRISGTEDGMLVPPPGLSHPSVGTARGTLQSGLGVGPRGGHTFGDAQNRGSTYSISADSIVSLAGGSKYPVLGFGGPGGTRPGTPGSGVGTPGRPGSFINSAAGSIMLGERQSVGGLTAYVYDPDEDDDDDAHAWLHDVDGDEEFIEYGFGPGRRRLYSGSVVDASVNGKQPSSEYTRKGSLGSMAKSYRKPEQIPLPTSQLEGSGLAPPPGHHSKMRIPQDQMPQRTWSSSISLRGFTNVTTLFALIAALLCLFIVLPVAKTLSDNGVAMKILGNTRINATGQAVDALKREFLEELIVVRFAPEGR